MFMKGMSEKVCEHVFGTHGSEKKKRMLKVMAAIIQQKGKILICQRGDGGNCAFLWEFPGGKLESGESKEECLIRECEEELGVQITIGSVFAKTTYQYPDREIAFTFFHAQIVAGEIVPKVHHQVRWVTPHEIMKYDFCPADIEIVEMLNKKGL